MMLITDNVKVNRKFGSASLVKYVVTSNKNVKKRFK